MTMRPVQAMPSSRGGARALAAAIVALALVCLSLGACGGSSNSGTTVTSGSSGASHASSSTQGASSPSAARATGTQTKPAGASGAPKASRAVAGAGYTLTGRCLLVGSVSDCNLPRALIAHRSNPEIKRAIAEYEACLRASGVRPAACRYELFEDVVLRSRVHR
jgi:hypothetical protein